MAEFGDDEVLPRWLVALCIGAPALAGLAAIAWAVS